jgi:hypothetical protein
MISERCKKQQPLLERAAHPTEFESGGIAKRSAVERTDEGDARDDVGDGRWTWSPYTTPL